MSIEEKINNENKAYNMQKHTHGGNPSHSAVAHQLVKGTYTVLYD